MLHRVKSPPKAYSYVRLSSGKQKDGAGKPRQIEKSKRWCENNGVELVEDDELTQDIAVSAKDGKNFKEGALGRFCAAAENGRVPKGSYLLVEDLDRISREHPDKASETMRSIVRAGVIVVDMGAGQKYTKVTLNQPMIYLQMVWRFIMAYEENIKRANRVFDAIQKNFKRALIDPTFVISRRTPAWINTIEEGGREKHVLDLARSEIVRQIFVWYMDHDWGLDKIRDELNNNPDKYPPFGTPTVREKPRWISSYIAKIISHPAVYGARIVTIRDTVKEQTDEEEAEYSYHDETIRGNFPAIPGIDEPYFDRVQRKIKERSQNVPRGRKGENYSHLFKGLMTCAYCRGPVHYENTGNKYIYLRCSNSVLGDCDAKSWAYKYFEKPLLTWIGRRDFGLANILHPAPDSDWLVVTKSKLAQAQVNLKKLTDEALQRSNVIKSFKDGTDGSPSPVLDALVAKLREIDAKAKEAAEEVAKYEADIADYDDKLKEFDKAKFEIKQLIEDVYKEPTEEQEEPKDSYELRSRIATSIKAVVKEIVLCVGDKNAPNALAWSNEKERYVLRQAAWRSMDEAYCVVRFKNGVTHIVPLRRKEFDPAIMDKLDFVFDNATSPDSGFSFFRFTQAGIDKQFERGVPDFNDPNTYEDGKLPTFKPLSKSRITGED
jgi:DNA invertase Pin-like site-specific DNA recombinase